jgi:hypothetical protein
MVWMLVAVVGELLLLLLALLLVSWMRQRGQRRRDAKAVQVLVERVRQGASERKQALQAFLSRNQGLQGEALTAATTALWRAEVAVLQQFAGIYRDRDAAAAAQFDIRLTAAVAPYHEFEVNAESAEPAPDGEAPDPDEVDSLRRENKRLSDELKITMETMSRMLNEYSTMFSGAPPGDSPPIAAAPPAKASDASTLASSHAAAGDEHDEGAGVMPGASESEDAAVDATWDVGPAMQSTDDDLDVEVTVDAASPPDTDAADPGELADDEARDSAPTERVDGDKGADLEAVSELLIAGSAERVTAEGGRAEPAASGADLPPDLFDGAQDEAADAPIDQDTIDDLFDVADGLAPDQAADDAPEAAESEVSEQQTVAGNPGSDRQAALRGKG